MVVPLRSVPTLVARVSTPGAARTAHVLSGRPDERCQRHIASGSKLVAFDDIGEEHEMIAEDKYIEILTAALQRATISGADVQWNVKIGNRQFDVLATLPLGMHSVLLGYEVKNKTRKVSVEAMDAFVTKARDAGINKAIFVSTSGFQSGTIDVAKRHAVDLFTLEILPSGLPSIDKSSAHIIISQVGAPPFEELEVDVANDNQHMNAIEQIDLHYSDGSVIALPDDPTQMSYYVEKSRFSNGKSLGDLIDAEGGRPVPIDQTDKRDVVISDNIIPPDTFFLKNGNVDKARLHIKGVTGKVLASNARFELTSIKSTVRYTDVLSGKSIEVPANSLPVGSKEFRPGDYYFLYDPLRYFHCEKIEDDTALIDMVESFQSAELVQASFMQSNAYSRYYFELFDKKIITRLEARLRRMKEPRPPSTQKKPFPFFKPRRQGFH